MTQLLVSCVVLYLAIITLQVATADDWYQKRVDTPFFDGIAQTRHRNRKKGVGQYCRTTSECHNRLCCTKSRSGLTTCQPLSRFGYTCTDEQARGGYYLRSCPCLSRHAVCHVYSRNTNIGVCSYRNNY
uniref:Ixodegrin B n=1 Tax=Rhipicephalus zambeziensis TaxID=60191 RepID=A0A224YKY0_9ACAR